MYCPSSPSLNTVVPSLKSFSLNTLDTTFSSSSFRSKKKWISRSDFGSIILSPSVRFIRDRGHLHSWEPLPSCEKHIDTDICKILRYKDNALCRPLVHVHGHGGLILFPFYRHLIPFSNLHLLCILFTDLNNGLRKDTP